MKTLISKIDQPPERKISGMKTHFSFIFFIIFLLSFIFSAYTLYPQVSEVKNDETKNKRLDILEKLENGISINSEDIRSSYSDFIADNNEFEDFCCREMPDIQPFPKFHPFPGPFFYQNHDGKDHVIISDNDIKMIHKQLSENMEELRINIESFRNSEDFLIMHDELKKWNDNFRNEIEKMRQEMLKSEKETRSMSTVHNLM
jgi:hypothetical protein